MVHRHYNDRNHLRNASSSFGSLNISVQQAWAILHRHARDEVAPLRLRELCTDEDRVSALVAVHNTNIATTNRANSECGTGMNRILIVDISRQLLTDVTMNHLLALSTAVGLKQFIQQVAWGSNNPDRPVRPTRLNTNMHNTSGGEGMHLSAHRINSHGSPDGPKKAQPHPHIHMTFSHDTLGSIGQPSTAATSSGIPSLHLASRVPVDKGYTMYDSDGTDVLTGIHQTWHRLERYSDAVRMGKLKGATGAMFRDIIVVGQGVAIAALHFIFTALMKDERANGASRVGLSNQSGHDAQTKVSASSAASMAASRLRMVGTMAAGALQQHTQGSVISSSSAVKMGGRRIKFVTSVDPVRVASIVSDLDPAATLVVSIALTGNEETSLATNLLKQWLVQGLTKKSTAESIDTVLTKHMILVTGNDRIATSIHKPESVYVIPEHTRCEPFTTFTVATLLPLSVVFGWPVVQELLAGAHDLDTHFVETNPRRNLPVLLALTDIWNSSVLMKSSPGRAMVPFTEALNTFPAYVEALESQVCCSPNTTHQHLTSMVFDVTSLGALDRALYETGAIVNSEIVMAMDTQVEFNSFKELKNKTAIHAAQDALMCSFFAQADELAFGTATEEAGGTFVSSPQSASSPFSGSPNDPAATRSSVSASSGNRPSTLVMCGKLDAFACGQLIALSEHRAIVKAHILAVDPFSARETGHFHRRDRSDGLSEALSKLYTAQISDDQDTTEDDDKEERPMNLSTRTLLGHYAGLMRSSRAKITKGEVS